MITTRKISKKYIQKELRESKWYTPKNKLNTKEGNNGLETKMYKTYLRKHNIPNLTRYSKSSAQRE